MGTIIENIADVQKRIQTDPGLAREIGQDSIEAILNGVGSAEWGLYVSHFASNRKQLNRLLGKDTEFMKGDYSKLLLAYLAASAPCMGGTELKLITDLDSKVRDLLDKDL